MADGPSACTAGSTHNRRSEARNTARKPSTSIADCPKTELQHGIFFRAQQHKQSGVPTISSCQPGKFNAVLTIANVQSGLRGRTSTLVRGTSGCKCRALTRAAFEECRHSKSWSSSSVTRHAESGQAPAATGFTMSSSFAEGHTQ